MTSLSLYNQLRLFKIRSEHFKTKNQNDDICSSDRTNNRFRKYFLN